MYTNLMKSITTTDLPMDQLLSSIGAFTSRIGSSRQSEETEACVHYSSYIFRATSAPLIFLLIQCFCV